MNWFDGIKPGLGPFASVLQTPFQMFLAAVWAVAFLWSSINLIRGFARLSAAKKDHRPLDSDDAGGGILIPLIATIGLGMIGLITGAAVSIAK